MSTTTTTPKKTTEKEEKKPKGTVSENRISVTGDLDDDIKNDHELLAKLKQESDEIQKNKTYTGFEYRYKDAIRILQKNYDEIDRIKKEKGWILNPADNPIQYKIQLALIDEVKKWEQEIGKIKAEYAAKRFYTLNL